MDPTKPETEAQQEQSKQTQPAQSKQQKTLETITTFLSKNKQFTNKKVLLRGGVVLFLLIFIPLIILLFSGGKIGRNGNSFKPTPTPAKKAKQQKTKAVKEPSHLLIYGTWTSQSSVIRAINLTTDQSKIVARLPLTIKKVNILSPDSLIYIDHTDNNDHGQRISVYNIKEKQIVTNIPAAKGFGIDDYVLSPNKKYLAIWEVAFSSETHTLQKGESRVYAVNLNRPAVVNLLYDESVTKTIPIHYPRAILNDGTVFADQFIPNDTKGGTGWAYGMSTVDFDGTNKQDISSMKNGTYGTQPSLSPDGKFLLFAGYDGSNGKGTKITKGYRQAILTPNTVELLDTKTMKRYKLPNLPDTNMYPNVQWDPQSGNVVLSILSPDTKQMGVYLYNLHTLQDTQIPLPTTKDKPFGFVAHLSNTKTLIGIQSTDASNLGNLGNTYAYAYTQMDILDDTGKVTYVSVPDPFMQYMTILPGNYFKNVLGAHTTASQSAKPAITYAVLKGTENTNPQHYAFFLKTTLASLRLQGKSTTACLKLADARCSALDMKPASSAFKLCQTIEHSVRNTTSACY